MSSQEVHTQQTPAGHDAHGRFTKGNSAGRGNPFGRQVAALRTAILACVTPQDVQDVMAAMLLQAKKGNVAAAKLYLSYSAGKPAETVNPDRADADEWQVIKDDGVRDGAVLSAAHSVPAQLASDLVQVVRPAIAEGIVEQLAPGMPRAAAGQVRQTAAPSTTAANGQATAAGKHDAPSAKRSSNQAAPSAAVATGQAAPSATGFDGSPRPGNTAAVRRLGALASRIKT